MTAKNRPKAVQLEEEIDRAVVAQAEDDSAWEKPVRVRRSRPSSLSLPADLVARAKFLANMHHTKTVDDWLARIIQERVELEEAAFVGAKRELVSKHSGG